MIDLESIAVETLRRLGRPSRGVSVIALNRSTPSETAVVGLAFADGSAVPTMLIKATDDAERGAALRREFENLRALQTNGAPELRSSVPEPFLVDSAGELTVLAEQAIPGTRMKNLPPDSYFGSSRFRGHLRSVMAFLLALHRCNVGEPDAVDARDAVSEYRARFRVGSDLAALLDETTEALDGYDGPRSAWHGDFCTANLLLTEDDRLGVIDWEFPLVRSWPLADLLFFLTSIWCVPYARGSSALRENYRTLFFEPHPLQQPIRGEVRAFVEALGIEPRLLLPLSAISWVVLANRKHRTVESGPPGEHLPLILLENETCTNLELLATHRTTYLLS